MGKNEEKSIMEDCVNRLSRTKDMINMLLSLLLEVFTNCHSLADFDVLESMGCELRTWLKWLDKLEKLNRSLVSVLIRVIVISGMRILSNRHFDVSEISDLLNANKKSALIFDRIYIFQYLSMSQIWPDENIDYPQILPSMFRQFIVISLKSNSTFCLNFDRLPDSSKFQIYDSKFTRLFPMMSMYIKKKNSKCHDQMTVDSIISSLWVIIFISSFVQIFSEQLRIRPLKKNIVKKISIKFFFNRNIWIEVGDHCKVLGLLNIWTTSMYELKNDKNHPVINLDLIIRQPWLFIMLNVCWRSWLKMGNEGD
jgi:hypothetical protein